VNARGIFVAKRGFVDIILTIRKAVKNPNKIRKSSGSYLFIITEKLRFSGER